MTNCNPLIDVEDGLALNWCASSDAYWRPL